MALLMAIVLVFIASIVGCHIIAKRRSVNPVFRGIMGAYLALWQYRLSSFQRQWTKNEKYSSVSVHWDPFHHYCL